MTLNQYDKLIIVQNALQMLPPGWVGRVRQAHGPHEESQIVLSKGDMDHLESLFRQVIQGNLVYWTAKDCPIVITGHMSPETCKVHYNTEDEETVNIANALLNYLEEYLYGQ